MHALLFVLLGVLPATATTTPGQECPEFTAKLETCTPYKCQFTHPFTGEKMERNIIGMKDGKCAYVEQMPNGGRMECGYDEPLRKRVAEYFRNIETATAAGTPVKSHAEISLGSKGAKTTSTTTINGKEMDNPLQEAMNKGDCKISGYDQRKPTLHASASTSSPSSSRLSSSAQSSVARTATAGTLTPAERDRNERIIRTMKARQQFMKTTEHPYGWKDHVIGYIVPLCKGGADTPSNMRWQTVEEAKVKDATDCAHQ